MKEIEIPECPDCKTECEVTKPFRVITQIARRFDCPKCGYGGLQKVGSVK